MGQEYRLVYRETIQYVVGDITADIYQLEGQRDTHVLFLEDGRLYGFLQPPVVTLKIDRKAAQEEVAEELMRVLSPEIDFSQYRQWECEQSVPGMEKEEGTGFGLYLFTWYNTKNGIMTDDFLRVAVQDNGQVSGLILKGNAGHSFAEIRDDVSVEDYHGIIEERIREVLSKRACTLLAARTRNCTITVYQGKYYLNCTVGVEYSTASGNQAAEAMIVLVKV